MKEKVNLVKGYISNVEKTLTKQSFTGEVVDDLIKWPKELGVKHPFDFCDVEDVYKKFGLINGIINKFVNNIVGEFTVHSDDEKVLKELKDFVKSNNLPVVLREFIKEGFIKGSGFLEIDVKEKKVKILNANDMYVLRNKKGVVLGYNQHIGDPSKFGQKKTNPLKPNQIAHLKINSLAGAAYGLGIIWPSERVIENMILIDQDKQKLISRKAGAPIHVAVGIPGEAVQKSAVDDANTMMKYMTNRTEWVTDANVKMTTLDFGEIGKNLQEAYDSNLRQLIAAMNMPEVLLNSGQLNEGIANTQLESFARDMLNYQDMLEDLLINQLFKPLLESQGLSSDDLDFIWNIPGQSEINSRIEKLNMVMSGMGISPNLKRMLELEVARLLNIQDAEKYLPEPEEGLNEQREAEDQAMKQVSAVPNGVRPKAPPQPRATATARESHQPDFGSMDVKSFLEIQEANGLTYSDYLVAILKHLRVDKFDDLRAITEKDLSDGLLSENEINKLRTILKEGFRNNQTIRQIEQNIKESINLKDRIAENGAIIPADNRAETIARTEVVRLSNEGLKTLYQDNGIKNVMWAASMSDRTCPLCMAKDGQVYPITEAFGDNIPPLHQNCRCALIAT